MVGHEVISGPKIRAIPWLEHWQRIWAQVACGGGLAIGGFLLWRRINGDLQRPLPPVRLLAVGFGLVLAAFLVRRCWVGDASPVGRRLLPAVALSLVGLAVSLPLTHPLALAGFWFLLIITESTFLFRPRTVECSTKSHETIRSLSADSDDESRHADIAEVGLPLIEPDTAPTLTPSTTGVDVDDPTSGMASESLVSSNVRDPEKQFLQQLFRTRDANGQEVLYGELRAEFAVGDRQVRLHVAFCPPVEQVPQVHAEATHVDEGLGDVTVNVAQVLPQGARIDVEVAEPAAMAGAVQVEFYAAVESPNKPDEL